MAWPATDGYANPQSLTASFGIAALGLITLLSLAPARRGSHPVLLRRQRES